MKKYLVITGIVVGVAAVGVAGYIIALQLFPRVVNESRNDIPAKTQQSTPEPSPGPKQGEQINPVAQPVGEFEGLGGHQASGQASIITGSDGAVYIRLEDNFSVTNGPDLYVYVGNDKAQQQEVAVLKGTKGGQNYKLPSNIDPASFDTVWIYCKRFSTPFAKAKLTL